MNWRTVCGGVCAAAVIALAAANVARAKEAGTHATAERLVADALRAELAGNSAQRRVLLSQAIDAAPEYLPARWQSGQVFVGDEWLPVDKAQQAAASDPKRAEYTALRKSGGDSLAGQLALARWCRKNSFVEEAKFHWRTVLAQQPNHEEALRALGVRWYDGRLMSHAEIQSAKAASRAWQEAAKEFAPQLARWERLLDAGDLKSRDQALGEIRALRDPPTIAAIEELTLGQQLATNAKFERCLHVSQAFVAALDEMPNQAATQSLVRHAVCSQLASVREAATAALKKRPPHDYLPQLLGSLAMPVESSFRVVTDTDGSVHYFHSLYREGPQADWSFEGRLSAMQHDLQGPTFVTIDDRIRGEFSESRFGAANNPAVRAEMASVAKANQQRFGSQATAAEQQIAAINQSLAAANRLIVPVLVAATGEDFGENPQAWWDWWERYNEYSSDGETPVYEQRVAESSHRYYRQPDEHYYRFDPPPPPPRRYSCFAAGTQVWTKTGRRQIETLEIGDLVLAQDPNSGELAYKPVVGRTVRPPSPTVTLRCGKEEIQSTLGHPFWVAGIGWRMAKELGEDANLHGIKGPVPIDAVSEADEAEAYNLIVADFATYFVGEAGVLVHDNTPRKPTSAKLPGLAQP